MNFFKERLFPVRTGFTIPERLATPALVLRGGNRFTYVTAHDFDPQSFNAFVAYTAICFTTCSMDYLHGKHLSVCKLYSTFLAHQDEQDVQDF